jgi:hypothetical protein
MGGHKRKAIRGAHHLWLAARIRERDFTFRGLVAELAERAQDGLPVGLELRPRRTAEL